MTMPIEFSLVPSVRKIAHWVEGHEHEADGNMRVRTGPWAKLTGWWVSILARFAVQAGPGWRIVGERQASVRIL
jgi:hypothetical protein